MSRTQQLILVCGLTAILLAAAFPPWRFVGTHSHSDTYDVTAGYGFVLDPPNRNFREGGQVPPDLLRVDAGLLLVELASIVSITGLVLVGLGCCTRCSKSPSHSG